MTNQEIIESQKEEIDCKLDDLQCRIDEINSENKFYNYEKDKQWNYYPKVNWVKLEIWFKDPEKLIKALNVINHMIQIYKSSWYSWEIYAEEDMWSKWTNYAIIDLKVDNRFLIPDTTFLKSETIQSIFWIKDNRDKIETKKIADFLNKILKSNAIPFQEKEAN